MQFLNRFIMQLPMIFSTYLALGVTKEIFNKRSSPHTWQGTILDLLDTRMELKRLGQCVWNCRLMLMYSALPQIPKTADSLKKSQKSQLDKMLDKVLKQLHKIYSYVISLENWYLDLSAKEQRRIGFSPVQLDKCWIYNVLDLHR